MRILLIAIHPAALPLLGSEWPDRDSNEILLISIYSAVLSLIESKSSDVDLKLNFC